MEEGKQDTVIPPGNAQKLFDAASDPKQIDWYPDQGHIPDPMVIYSAVMTFLQKYIPTSG
jgi:esterase/lipase